MGLEVGWQLGMATNFGKDFLFFKAAQLGGCALEVEARLVGDAGHRCRLWVIGCAMGNGWWLVKWSSVEVPWNEAGCGPGRLDFLAGLSPGAVLPILTAHTTAPPHAGGPKWMPWMPWRKQCHAFPRNPQPRGLPRMEVLWSAVTGVGGRRWGVSKGSPRRTKTHQGAIPGFSASRYRGIRALRAPSWVPMGSLRRRLIFSLLFW